MRKLIVSEFVSLDGVMEAPGGEEGYRHSGWTFAYPMHAEQMQFKLDEVLEADALLLGRVTYKGFAAAWPGRTDEAGFADKMNRMPKYVVSSTLDELEWNNSTLLEGDVAEEVANLKEQDGGPILVAGSRTLVQTLGSARRGRSGHDGCRELSAAGLADRPRAARRAAAAARAGA